MKMLIVESKAKSKTIQKYLGRKYTVRASIGHVQDLPSGRTKDGRKAMWASRQDELPQPPWEYTERAKKVVDGLISDLNKGDYDEVIIATDPDREGEFIAWRLEQLLGDIAPCTRIVFNEITKDVIMEAIDNSRQVDMKLVDAAKVRRFMDRLVGYRTTNFARSWRLKSMGRVQTPTLGFVVERELEREAFTPTPYFSVKAEAESIEFKARFHESSDDDAWRDQDGKFDASRTHDGELATEAIAALQAQDSLQITNNKPSKQSRRPQPPFTTDAMLQAAGSRSGWSPGRTMRVAGELYNGGHITYMRTDSTRTSAGARATVKEYIANRWGEDHIGGGVLGKKSGGTQDAHEAIRPTAPDVERPEGVSGDMLQLYRLIWARFAASQMNNSEYERRNLTATVEGFSKTLTATASWRVHSGWEAAFDDINNRNVTTSPPEADIDAGSLLEIRHDDDTPQLIEDETKPPKRYREHSLVAEMKERGIGRPSTYAATITKIQARKYVDKEGNSLVPTALGRLCWSEVAPMYTQQGDDSDVSFLFSAEFTADMEQRLDAIETGERTAPSVWHGFTTHFRGLHESALAMKRMTPTPNQQYKFDQLVANISSDEVAEVLDVRDADALSGEEMSEVIGKLSELGSPLASEKQVSYILSLVDQIPEMEIDDALALVESRDVQELDMKSASTLIGKLKELTDELPRPVSEKQMNLIKQKSEQLKLSEQEICAKVGLKGYDELTGGRKGNASDLISILIKESGGNRRRSRGSGRKKGGGKSS